MPESVKASMMEMTATDVGQTVWRTMPDCGPWAVAAFGERRDASLVRGKIRKIKEDLRYCMSAKIGNNHAQRA